jgi:hypothetical protein
VCLNSLGIPFAQLLAIDEAVRNSIKERTHQAFELYMDGKFFHSLRLQHTFDKNTVGKNLYRARMMSGECTYYYAQLRTILDNLAQREKE